MMRFAFFAIFFLNFCLAVFAEIPRQLSYQGRIVNKAGQPIANAPHTVTIRLYTAAVNGQVLWSDSFTLETKNGYFNVILGSQVTLLENLDFSGPYFLGVTLEGEKEMEPRQALSTVPYAFRAEKANYAEQANTAVNGVPKGAIILWSGDACPVGYSRFTPLDQRFPRGATGPMDYGDTGGNSIHSHTATTNSGGSHSYSFSGITSLFANKNPSGYPNGSNAANEDHNHSFSGNTNANGNHTHTLQTNEASSTPPYYNILFCIKD